MAHILKARVAETSTSTGTGDFTLSGAVTAHKTFASRMSVADTTEYVIYAVDGSGVPTGEWEEGTGTYSAANTLTRTTVVESSNADGAVDFGAGAKVVIMTPLSSRVAAILKGGASGEMLVKNGSADFAWAWVTAPTGTNTGDQDLSGYSLTSHNHTGTYDPAGTASSAVAAHAGTGGTAHANAVASGAAGFMTGADKAKLDGVAAGAQVNPASTDALTEGSTNLYSTAARIRATVLTGLSTAAGTVVAATHTILEAIGFLQKQVSDNTTAIAGKQATLVSATNIKTVNSTSLLGSGNISVTADLTAPGPIGGTTPSTVAATTVSATTSAAIGTGLTGNVLVKGDTLYPSVDFKSGATLKASILAVASSGAGFFDFAGITYRAGPSGAAIAALSSGGAFSSNGGYILSGGYGSFVPSASGDSARITVGTSGTLGIYDSTNTSYRDLKLRNHIGTGNLATGIAAKTAAYTATTSDGTIECDATTAAFTITLFACSGNAGKIIIVKKTDASINAVTVDGNASETIDGAATVTLATQYADVILQVNAAGTGWHKLSGM